MPALHPSNITAVQLYQDIESFGAELTLLLWKLELDDYERGELLTRLRVIADEVGQVRKRKLKEMEQNNG
jgi:hypothetical protein